MTKLFAALLVCAAPFIALTSPAAAAPREGKMLFHVVSFKFKDTAKKEDIKKVEDAFAALKEKIPGIVALTWGTNVSPEKHDKGFTHCFILVFNDDKDRDVYLTHADHQAFGKLVGPVLADVFVLDFWGDAPGHHAPAPK